MGFYGGIFFFLFLLQNIDCGYSLEPVWGKDKKKKNWKLSFSQPLNSQYFAQTCLRFCLQISKTLNGLTTDNRVTCPLAPTKSMSPPFLGCYWSMLILQVTRYKIQEFYSPLLGPARAYKDDIHERREEKSKPEMKKMEKSTSNNHVWHLFCCTRNMNIRCPYFYYCYHSKCSCRYCPSLWSISEFSLVSNQKNFWKYLVLWNFYCCSLPFEKRLFLYLSNFEHSIKKVLLIFYCTCRTFITKSFWYT